MPVYLAARDLAGLPIGTHQFIIIENQANPYPAPKINGQTVNLKSLGNGKSGYVIGTHNRDNLAVEFFEKSDYEATLEYFDKKRLSFFKSDFDTEVIKVEFPSVSEQAAVRKIFNLIEAYHINQSTDKIKYPATGFGFNSNSWAQTVIALAGGKVKKNLNGADISNGKRIPKTYFDAVCPVKPRSLSN